MALIYEYEFVPRLSFRLEPGYSGKGGRKKTDSTDALGNVTTYTDTWRFDYIEIPMLFRCRPFSVAGLSPFIDLGLLDVQAVDVYKGWLEIDTFEDYRRAWALLKE